ncbi:MAG: hypothetical protein U0T82_07620 [Bacteroidales bacterium]
MIYRSENRELPLYCLLLLAAVLVFLFNHSLPDGQSGHNTISPAFSHAQALSPVLPGISNPPAPASETDMGIGHGSSVQEGCQRNLQQVTRVILQQVRIEGFQRLLHSQQQFYYFYFQGGNADIPSNC